jgi:hypothetical protein
MALLGVISQKTFPGVGNIDDCWVIAPFWAAKEADRSLQLPTVEAFREAADSPDDFEAVNGGGDDEIIKAVNRLWPHFSARRFRNRDFDGLVDEVRAGATASVGVLSEKLAKSFGHVGGHQIGVAWDGKDLRVANPLAPNGSVPTVISARKLRDAAFALHGGARIAAVVFPRQEGEMRLDISGTPIGKAKMRSQGGTAFNLARSKRKVAGGMVRNVFGEVRLREELSTSLPVGESMLIVTFDDAEAGARHELFLLRTKDTDWPRGRTA